MSFAERPLRYNKCAGVFFDETIKSKCEEPVRWALYGLAGAFNCEALHTLCLNGFALELLRGVGRNAAMLEFDLRVI